MRWASGWPGLSSRFLRSRLCSAVVLAGCIADPTVFCEHEVCPAGAVCTTAGTCTTRDAIAACDGKAPHAACAVDGADGACEDGACSETICGDGRVDPTEACDGAPCSPSCDSTLACGNGFVDVSRGETCDDGDLGSRDGCSSSCHLENETWEDITSPSLAGRAGFRIAWDPRAHHAVLFGGFDADHVLGDTWIYSLEEPVWRRIVPPHAPSPRSGYALAYDSDRDVVVLFGGADATTDFDDTWTWDGTTWEELPTTTRPPARRGGAMAFDPKRHRLVLAGGGSNVETFLQDTWEFDGTTWTEVVTTNTPFLDELAWDSKNEVVLAYDDTFGTSTWNGTTWSDAFSTVPHPAGFRMVTNTTRQSIVLFGGMGSGDYDATFEWDGSQWTELPNTIHPSSRSGFGMTYLPSVNTMLVTGGAYQTVESTTLLSDVWLFATDTWSVRADTNAQPNPRITHGMTYDARRGRVVVYGGSLSGDLAFPDLWELDGRGWHRMVSTTTPPLRVDALVAYDRARGKTVVFGGRDASTNQFLDETREWNGVAWSGKLGVGSLEPRNNGAMCFDGARGKIVIFGGYPASASLPTDAVAEWDGATWTAIATTGGPGPRFHHAMACDAHRHRIVVFGGYDVDDTTHDDTWELDGTTWIATTPTVRPPRSADASMTYDPVLERVILVVADRTFTWDGTTWTERAPLAAHPVLVGAQLAYDEIQRELVLFGGLNALSQPNERTWAYRIGAERDQENCMIAGDDIDGDGLAGCADPDCIGRCRTCGSGTCDPVEDHRICPVDCPTN